MTDSSTATSSAMSKPAQSAAAKAIGYDGGLTCALGVRSLDKSIPWYRDVLGFELAYKVDEMGWCEFHSPVAGVMVGLSQVENSAPKGGATPTWGVKNIDAARAQLETKGVKFDGPTVVYEGMVKLATFFDPDGNKFMLYQGLSGQ